MKLIKKILVLACVLPLFSTYCMENSTVLCKTSDEKYVRLPVEYLNKSRTFYNDFIEASKKTDKQSIPTINVFCSKETFILLMEALKIAYLKDSLDKSFCEKLSALTTPTQGLIDLANAACYADFQLLIATMIEIIGQRCLDHESYLPDEMLQSYKKMGLTDEFVALVIRYLNSPALNRSSMETEPQTITIFTNDDETFTIPIAIAAHFKIIQNIHPFNEELTRPIELPNINSTELEKLLHLLNKLLQSDEEQSDLINELLSYDIKDVITLFNAADYLNSDTLCELLLSVIEQKLKNPELLYDNDTIAWILQNQQNRTILINHLIQTPFIKGLLNFICKSDKIEPVALRGYSGPYRIAFSPDEKILATTTSRTIVLWDTATVKALRTLDMGRTFSLAFSPDGKFLATGSDGKNAIKLWNPHTGDCIHTFQKANGHFTRLTFSPNGKILASVCASDSFQLWNTSTFRCLYKATNINRIPGVAFSPDGKFLAACSENILKIWDTNTFDCIYTLDEHTAQINRFAFSPQGHFVATCSDDTTIKLWDVDTGRCVRTFNDTDKVTCLTFSPDEKILVTASSDHYRKLWDVHTGKCLKATYGPQFCVLAFSPHGLFLAGSSKDSVSLWDTSTNYSLIHNDSHREVDALRFSPNGQFLATASFGEVFLRRMVDTAKIEEYKYLPPEQLLLLAFCYNAFANKITFDFSWHPYLNEVYNNCSSAVRDLITQKLMPTGYQPSSCLLS